MSRQAAGPLRLRHRVLEAVRRRALWRRGDRVAVAVSGGLDSVVLLDVLAATVRVHGAALSVVTVDHGMRPGSADDAAFVEAIARAMGLACARVGLALGRASEAEAREARYAALEDVGVERIALAHHRDDLAETVLLQLLRGSGPTGMRWRRGRYVRPLLGTGRDELAAWARARGLAWREDPTNRDPAFLRNRVRHEVMPLLEQLRPGAAKAMARSALAAAADAELLEALVEADPQATGAAWSAAWVATAPESIVRRALLRRVPDLGARGLDAVIAAAARGRGRVPLPGRRAFLIGDGVVRLSSRDFTESDRP